MRPSALAVDVTGRVIERNEELTTILPQERWRPQRSRAPLAWRRLRTRRASPSAEYFGSAGLVPRPSRSPPRRPTTPSTLLPAPLRLRNGPARGTAPGQGPRRADGDGWTITGDKWYVPGVDAADVILVIARTVGGPRSTPWTAQPPGSPSRSLPSLDPTRPLAPSPSPAHRPGGWDAKARAGGS